jgi:hypothetical protein
MIPKILPVKCYNGILCACGIFHILFALININKHFLRHCQGHNWYKDFDHQHTTSFSRITPVLLNCGIRQGSKCRFDLPVNFHKKRRKALKNSRVPEHSRPITRIQITSQVTNTNTALLINCIMWVMVSMIKKGEIVLLMDL